MRVTFAPQSQLDAAAAAAYQVTIDARNAKTRAMLVRNMRLARHRHPVQES